MSFQIALREGLVGGFVGPTIRQYVQVQGDSSGASITQSTLKPGSQNDYSTFAGGASTEDLSSVLELLKEKLRGLPTEDPVGSEDIYGEDIALAFMSDDLEWVNGGPQGCSGSGTSNVQATQEQKETFKSIVEIVRGLGQQYAVTAQ
ncbi:hypothetical protein K501DRAFT_321740 [Backusella circina FSU 941]|nr:hypothetical protein K501DRAFT_321740 [Backusella circina FSU 941]